MERYIEARLTCLLQRMRDPLPTSWLVKKRSVYKQSFGGDRCDGGVLQGPILLTDL
jgi:hypothetical protein